MGSALDLAIASINKEFGAGTVFDTTSAVVPGVPKLSFGSIRVDLAAGGGAGKGRILEVYGPESSGKTTLCLHLVKSAQEDPDYIREGRKAAFVDVEQALDLEYAKNCIGVDTDNLIISQPDYGEMALEIVESLMATRECSVIVVDSVSNLIPRAELEGDMGQSHMGLQARLMSQACRKLAGLCNKTGTILVFTNQIRMKIGVMFGSPETTSGGQALRFTASQRIEIRKQVSRTVRDKDGFPVMIPSTIKFVKNKLAPPFRTAEVDMRFKVGIDITAENLDLAVEHDIVDKSGSWHEYIPSGRKYILAKMTAMTLDEAREYAEKDPLIVEYKARSRQLTTFLESCVFDDDGWRVNSREAAITHLNANPELLAELKQQVRDAVFPTAPKEVELLEET